MTRSADPLDDAVARMLLGDDDAFRVIYRALQPGLERYLRALVGPNDAEDIASETWTQACRDLGGFKGGADGFRGWITTIGRHRALDHLRAEGRRPRSAGTIEDFAESVADVADVDVAGTVAAIMSTETAIDLIAALPQEQAEAILLRAVMGLDAKSAGRILGRSAGAVRTAAYRGLRTLALQIPQPASDVFPIASAEELR